MSRLAHTPLLDAWREALRAATAMRGKKTALARFMAAHRGQPVHTWQANITRLLAARQAPGAEDLLATLAWMAAEGAPHAPTPRAGLGHARQA